MKMSVASWTVVQDNLPVEDRDGNPDGFFYEIERRTFGKRNERDVAIRVPEHLTEPVLRIMDDHNLEQVITEWTTCDHMEPDSVGGVDIEWDETDCPICEGKGQYKTFRRVVPRLPKEN